MIGTSLFSAGPVTPTEAITCLAWNSLRGRMFEKCWRPTWSGWLSATSSMSIPPMSLKRITGCLRMPSQTTPA